MRMINKYLKKKKYIYIYIYIYQEERQKIIDHLTFNITIEQYNNGISRIINLLDNTLNQPSKFRTKNWVEINMMQIKLNLKLR